MSRRSVKKRILGASLIALVLALVYLYVTTVPIYPAFQKEVQSAETFHRLLEKYPDIVLPQIDSSKLDVQYYYINLDGRTRLAKPVGFSIVATSNYENHSMYNSFSCTPRNEYIRSDLLYREIPIQIFNIKDTNCLTSLKFMLEGHVYEFKTIHELSENEAPEIDQWVEENLIRYAQQVIDRALT